MILPAKLNRKQFQFVNQMKKYGIQPDSQEFADAWEEEGLNNVPAKSESVQVSRSAQVIADDKAADMAREAELVLATLYRFDVVRVRACKRCHQDFATNYNYQRYCSNLCRAAALNEKGITWNFERPDEDRWGGQPPSTISPAALSALREWAIKLVAASEHTTKEEPAPAVVETKPAVKKLFGWQVSASA